MKHILLLCIVPFAFTGIYAQHTIRLSIKKSEAKQSLARATATINSLNKTTVADSRVLQLLQTLQRAHIR